MELISAVNMSVSSFAGVQRRGFAVDLKLTDNEMAIFLAGNPAEEAFLSHRGRKMGLIDVEVGDGVAKITLNPSAVSVANLGSNKQAGRWVIAQLTAWVDAQKLLAQALSA